MFLKMTRFEYSYFIRQPSFVVVGLVMFLLPFLSIAIEQIVIGVSNNNILLNSPFSIALTMLIMNFFGMFLVVNFVANTALRNHITNMSELLYSNPIKPLPYQLGRLFGAFLIVLTLSLLVPLGLLLGSIMPWLDPVRLSSISLYSYLVPYLVFTLPTCFILTCFFYTAAIRFKSIMAVYLCALGLFALYAMTSGAFSQSQHRELLALLDPFGLRAFFEITRYWTANQKNQEVVLLTDIVLYNRIFWMLFGAVVLLTFAKLFSELTIKPIKQKNKNVGKISGQQSEVMGFDINEFDATYDHSSTWLQFYHLLVFEVRQILLSPAFIVLLIFAIVVVLAELIDPSAIAGNQVYPLTKFMVELINNAFSLSLLIVITFYSAELVFRERNSGMGDIINSTPVTNIAFFLSKFFAMCIVILSMLFIAAATTITYQLMNNIQSIEISQYFTSLMYFVALPFVLLSVVAFLIQTLSPNKYIGMLFFVCFLFIPLAFANLGINHNMASYASSPQLKYSDMNGYAWFITTQYHYMFYWGSLAVGFFAISYAIWQRGPEVNILKRLQLLPYQLGKSGQVLIMLSLVSFVSFGTVIYYNTTQINEFYTESELNQIRIEYEKEFAQFEDLPVLSALDVDLNVAIFPSIRKMEVIARVLYENKSDQAIEQVLVNLPSYSSVNIVGGNGKNDPNNRQNTLGVNVRNYNSKFKTAWLFFDEPIQPFQTVELTHYITRQHVGFKDKNEDTSLIQNGTFINNFELLPYFGVKKSNYITDTHQRRRNGLSEISRANQIHDERYYNESFLGKNANKVEFKATISTSTEQTAVAPGKLVKYWQDSDRNYFIYESQSLIPNYFHILSARLKAKSVRHDQVDITVFYHQEHRFNVDNMLQAAKDALDYYQYQFTPYQYKQLNIIEFPGYSNFSQTYANTIAYSERLGFVTDTTDPGNFDTLYYETAHNVARQWFGHQLDAANVQGSRILIDGLSQYAALQVMQHTYGKAKIRHFLKYELDRYLTGRANEELKESPLFAEEGQKYVYHHKASLVFMAIADRIGQENLNQAIRNLLKRFAGVQSALATSIDLMELIKQQSPLTDHAFIEQQFTEIVLYNIELVSANIDSDMLRLNVNIEQYKSDELANETREHFDNEVEVLLFRGNPDDFSSPQEIVYRGKHPLSSGQNLLEIDLSRLSSSAQSSIDTAHNSMNIYVAVDPFIRFIDKNSDDNVQKLK